MHLSNSCLLISLLIFFNSVVAQSTTELKTAEYLQAIKNNPKKLSEFLLAMPKGADLHIHLTGSSYPENLLRYAHGDHLCINPNNYVVSQDAKCPAINLLDTAIKDPAFYTKVIDAWSMRHADPTVLGHNHFFAAFMKYDVIAEKHTAEILAEVMDRAGSQNIGHLELKIHPRLGIDLVRALDRYELGARKILHCDTPALNIGCQVQVRYIYEVFRENAIEDVLSRAMAGAQAVMHDKRFVGLDFVQPEDGKISMRDYALHMHLLRNIHRLYPNVPVTLHAGELIQGLVPSASLKSHVHDAVMIAKARRIGHGVDIADEDNAKELLQYMSAHDILVEINLSSNFLILHVPVKDHPLPLYMHYHVPVVLSTDDEGISRENLTQQYILAVNKFNLNYMDLKTMARNSLTYSFLPGNSLWPGKNYTSFNAVCKADKINAPKHTPHCQAFLEKSTKASMQWDLERSFMAFEQIKWYKKTGV